jgi:hypothetical protein
LGFLDFKDHWLLFKDWLLFLGLFFWAFFTQYSADLDELLLGDETVGGSSRIDKLPVLVLKP